MTKLTEVEMRRLYSHTLSLDADSNRSISSRVWECPLLPFIQSGKRKEVTAQERSGGSDCGRRINV